MNDMDPRDKYKSLRDIDNKDLIEYLDDNDTLSSIPLICICSEILRRMNEIKPLFDKDNHES